MLCVESEQDTLKPRTFYCALIIRDQNMLSLDIVLCKLFHNFNFVFTTIW